MEYWEFLLQKEGERSWLSLDKPSVEVQEGRYRIVAHSNRPNTNVEIRITHESKEEVPPKRRFQKRTRCTNSEGLMVVIPFTYLKSGYWELRCCGDLMSDFLGTPWQYMIQFQVLSKAVETPAEVEEPAEQATSTAPIVPAETAEPIASSTNSAEVIQPLSSEETVAEAQPALISLPPTVLELASAEMTEETAEPENLAASTQSPVQARVNNQQLSAEIYSISEWEPPTFSSENLPPLASVPHEPLTPSSLFTFETTEVVPVSHLVENSLQMVDEIIQEVVEPVWEDFQPIPKAQAQWLTEPSVNPHPSKTAQEFSAVYQSTAPDSTLVRLYLDQLTLVAHRGQPVIVSGHAEILVAPQLSDDETTSCPSLNWQGSLQMTLRDPQNSQLLVDVQLPIPEAVPFFPFSCLLEIPEDCPTRLMLGEVRVYDANSAEVAAQSFSVTADLEDLLGALTREQDHLNPPLQSLLVEPKSLDLSFLNFLQTSKKEPPLQLEPLQRQPIPEQIYQPNPAIPTLKSPELPTVGLDSTAQKTTTDEKNQGDQLSITAPSSDPSRPNERSNSENLGKKSLELPIISGSNPKVEPEVIADEPEVITDELEVIANEPEIDPGADLGNLMDNLLTKLANEERPGEILSIVGAAADSQTQEEAVSQESAQSEPEDNSAEESGSGESASPVETAFATLHVQERFWARLNALAMDAESSDWLEPEKSADLGSLDTEALSDSEGESVGDDAQTEGEFVSGEQQNQSEVSTKHGSQTAEQSQDLANTGAVDGGTSPDEETLNLQGSATAAFGSPNPAIGTRMPTTPFSFGAFGDWIDQEFVVDDEPLEPERPLSRGEWSRSQNSGRGASSQRDSQRVDDEPMPAPELIVPEGELTAGESVSIRVKLPSVLPQIYVKLWVHDRQTRTLLDGPRWLVDFTPTGLGFLETLTQLTVPFGSVELRFEAITVDTYTQQESHKVTIDRVVIPPNLPSWSLDDFQM